MRAIMFAALAGALLTVAPASGAIAAEAAVGEPSAEPKLVCKRNRDRTSTGSNLRSSERICKTQMEWDRLTKDAEDTMRRIDETSQQRLLSPGRMGGGPLIPGQGAN